mmetsp:Transcript_21734/g.76320  ORF Transcript_21734/g.76320 Transcript_21734/m.76320 type:complete len:200 (+) Transcript_21734:3161-3760(+)
MSSMYAVTSCGQRVTTDSNACRQFSRRSFMWSSLESSLASPMEPSSNGTIAFRWRPRRQPTTRLTVPIVWMYVTSASGEAADASMLDRRLVTICCSCASEMDDARWPRHAVARLRTGGFGSRRSLSMSFSMPECSAALMDEPNFLSRSALMSRHSSCSAASASLVVGATPTRSSCSALAVTTSGDSVFTSLITVLRPME